MYIGIDIGATHTRIAASRSLSDVQLIGSTRFATCLDFETAIQELMQQIQMLSSAPLGIGIGVPGRVSDDGRQFTRSTNLSSWTERGLVDILEERFHCPVTLRNDAVAQALAHARHVSGVSMDFLYLAWGTGIGAAMVCFVDGAPTVHKVDRAYIRPWEHKCGGMCLEARFQTKAEHLSPEQWEMVFADFRSMIEDLSDTLGICQVVLSGGITHKQKQALMSTYSDLSDPVVVFSDLGRDIGVYGGLAILEKCFKNSQS